MCMETRSQTVRPRWRYLLLIRAHFPGSPMCLPYAMKQSARQSIYGSPCSIYTGAYR